MNNDTIKAVAEAITTEILRPYVEQITYGSSTTEVGEKYYENIAQAAIEAMQIREMTVQEVEKRVQMAIEVEPLKDVPYVVACTLAKLGTIKIVGEV